MNIAIQGHPTKGKEVIQILESLGGKNEYDQSGSNERFVYFINNIGFIYSITLQMCSNERRIYTLEEFEKEFPFKIGDKVFLGEDDEYLYTIKSISIWHDGDIVYEFAENELHYTADKLTLYKEMKEERNITLTLNKAKEWYKKGGELKEIALQAFTEKELNSLPRSWEEFCKQSNPVASWRYNIPVKYEALFKLEQLRNYWRQGWKPDWQNSKERKHAIRTCKNDISIESLFVTHAFLSFPTYELALEFKECFRDLIEKAEDLIG